MNIDYTNLINDVVEFDHHYVTSGCNSRFGHPMQAYRNNSFMMYVLLVPDCDGVVEPHDHLCLFSESNLENLLKEWDEKYVLSAYTIDFGLMVAPDDDIEECKKHFRELSKEHYTTAQYRLICKDGTWSFSRSTLRTEFPLSVCYEDVGMARPVVRIPDNEMSFMSVMFMEMARSLKDYKQSELTKFKSDKPPFIVVKGMFDDGDIIERDIDVMEDDACKLAANGQFYRSMVIGQCNHIRASRTAKKSTYCLYNVSFYSAGALDPVRTIRFYVSSIGHTEVFNDTCPITEVFTRKWLGVDVPFAKSEQGESIIFTKGDKFYTGEARFSGGGKIEISEYEEVNKEAYNQLMHEKLSK